MKQKYDYLFDFESVSKDTLLRWWNLLNGWKWPEDLPNKPVGFDSLYTFFTLYDKRRKFFVTKYDFVSPVMHHIEQLTTREERLSYRIGEDDAGHSNA